MRERSRAAEGDDGSLKAVLRTLVIGYGNSLRRDDGVGPVVVGWLREELGGEADGFELVEAYQLMPELAETVSGVGRVIFIDASVAVHCGRVQIRRAHSHPQIEPGVGHRVSPEMILMLSEAMYGRLPVAWVVGIGVKTLAVGEGLSPEVERVGRRLARHLGYWLKRGKREVVSKR